MSAEAISYSTCSTHAHKISNLQVFFQVIFNYHEYFGQVIRRLSALFIYLSIYLFVQLQFSMSLSITLHIVFVILLSYLPTPPLGQDMTQGQFLSGV